MANRRTERQLERSGPNLPPLAFYWIAVGCEVGHHKKPSVADTQHNEDIIMA
jgi:hypothetical protein